MTDELWRKIPGYPNYKISTKGRVVSYARVSKVFLKPNRHKFYDSYETVILSVDSERTEFKIHRLVATVFIPNPNNCEIVDHIDSNITNNCVENLRWCTQKENTNYSKKLGSYTREIIQLNKNTYEVIKIHKSIISASKKIGISTSGISACISGRSPTAGGFRWTYLHKKIEYIPFEDEIFLPIISKCKHRSFNFPNYSISNYGTVMNTILNKRLKETMQNGYPSVYLRNHGVCKSMRISIHILVASFFVSGRTKEKFIVNHIDENKHNHHYINLEWVTSAENTLHSCGKKVYQMSNGNNNVIATYNSVLEAAIAITGSPKGRSSISSCCRGVYSSALGYYWCYKWTPPK